MALRLLEEEKIEAIRLDLIDNSDHATEDTSPTPMLRHKNALDSKKHCF